MTAWDFAAAHPVWTFVYVFLVCCLLEGAMGVVGSTIVRVVEARRKP